MKLKELLESAKQFTLANVNQLTQLANNKILQSKDPDADLIYAQTILAFPFDANDNESNTVLKAITQCALATEKPTSTLKPMAAIMELKQTSETDLNPSLLTFLNQSYEYINERKTLFSQKKTDDLKKITPLLHSQGPKKLSVKELSAKLGKVMGNMQPLNLNHPQTLGAGAVRSITLKFPQVDPQKKDIHPTSPTSSLAKIAEASPLLSSVKKIDDSLSESWQLETERKKLANLEEKYSQIQKKLYELTALKQKQEKENERLMQHLKITEEQREKYASELQRLQNPKNNSDYQLIISEIDKEKLLEDFSELIVEDKWFDYLHHVAMQLLSSESQQGAKNRVDELYKEYKDINTRALFSVRGKVYLAEERPSRNPIFNEQLVNELNSKLSQTHSLSQEIRTLSMKEADEICKPFYALLLKRAASLNENSQLTRRSIDPFLSDTALLNKSIILKRAEEKCINMVKAYEEIHFLQKMKETSNKLKSSDIEKNEATSESKSPKHSATLFTEPARTDPTLSESVASRLTSAINYSLSWALGKY